MTLEFAGGSSIWLRRVMWIAWPAFVAAGVLEVLIFAMLDPNDVRWFGQPLEMSRLGVYTTVFFILWCVVMLASGLTTLLTLTSFELNQCPFSGTERPDVCNHRDAS